MTYTFPSFEEAIACALDAEAEGFEASVLRNNDVPEFYDVVVGEVEA